MSLKTKILFWVVFLVGSILMRMNVHSKGKELLSQFIAANIDNKIESVDIVRKSTGIKLDDGREFVFAPISIGLEDSLRSFRYHAEKGDRILKKPYADTLYLIKGKSIYKYCFRKF